MQEQIFLEFQEQKHRYETLSEKSLVLIKSLLDHESINYHSITQRTKDNDSFKKKISKPEKNYKSINDITDISGIRIVTYFSEDVDEIAKIIESEFDVDKDNSIDKRKASDPEKFGYLSLHYVLSFNKARKELREYKSIRDLKFELQIRSILQHAWAEIEHDMGYKNPHGIPKEIKRKFARVAGLLEIADSEFNGLRSNLKKYGNDVENLISNNDLDIEINSLSLASAYKNIKSLIDLDKKISELFINQIEEANPKNFEGIAQRFKSVGIKKISDLENLAKDFYLKSYYFAKKWITFPSDKKISTGIGSLYLFYVYIAEGKNKNQIEDILRNSNINFTDITHEELATEIFNTYKIAMHELSNQEKINN